ncbi:hypothetical protein [Wolbachia endosymbiont of Folsomia candida]|uniref:hypothetical protein n=1 Tax=Wolbachia endosymbiont of Folsomia candida TaxID=169402 RepID=UPI000A89D566|nr:hypothetical protein [Wolbachia endosymbiont of Folsomia candida]APR98836.1 hypothetical protein ASM33_06450 [Wolbachia endosymbiont of Folsomia candida]
MAHIKLKKLIGIQVNGKKAVTNVSKASEEILLKEGINGLTDKDQKIVFAGQDYKGTFKATKDMESTGTGPTLKKTIEGELELYLERPENHFTIKDVQIKTNSTTHALSANGKEATIELIKTTDNKVTEKDSGWFTTELTGTAGSLKFGEWSDYDLPNQSYVDISFA